MTTTADKAAALAQARDAVAKAKAWNDLADFCRQRAQESIDVAQAFAHVLAKGEDHATTVEH